MAIVETILGSFLGSVLQVLFEKLASLGLDYAQRKIAPPSGISTGMLNKWEKMLVTIYVVLDDAEDKQLSGKGPVKLWLDDVRDLAYDMEDLLDEFAIQAAEVKSTAKSSTSRGRVDWKFSCFGLDKSSRSNLNPRLLMPETKVQEINGRLEEIVTMKARLNLTENAMNRSNNIEKRLPSTSLPETRFFGRETEEAEIVELLTGEFKNGNTTLCIVPIVGMGGDGKTALAQRVYNDARVYGYFDMRAWVCVSDVFDILDITKTILRSITGLSYEGEDLNGLQIKLKDSLFEKKFLVVLDDIWNEKYEKWTSLLKPFEAGAKGSKIIITTRNLAVVSITRALPYQLKELSIDNCTSLLAVHALGAANFERHPDLETIGKKIAEKCKGLPLAAKMLGSALCNERNPDKWEAILNNRIWETGKNDEVLPVLKLSYVHLPSYLKRCFAYCAVYPKDYEIERDELVLLWIAEGFLDGHEAEDILRLGRDHFDELVSRSFLQQSRVDESKFSMHDLLNDLANSIAGGTCFSSRESQVVRNENDASLEKARYASFISSEYVTSKFMRAYHRMKLLRSLMLLTAGPYKTIFISNKVLHDLLTKLKYLRAFSLCYCDIVEVPNCVGELKHLRYLNFSYTCIKSLPESIGCLCKLQALILRGCEELSTLPAGITKLVNLQFLDIRDTESLKEMPLGISNLKNITILSKFVIGQKKGSQLRELQNLPHLQGELFISDMQKVEEVRDVVDANLSGKQGLSNLFLRWGEDFENLWNERRESQVLHYLRPHTNLKSLTISHYGGAKIPSWLDGSYYSKLVSLCLRGCPNVTSLPSLGQLPSLRELSLKGLHAIRMIGSEVYGSKSPFTSLTTLKFEEMLAWKDWSRYAGDPEEEGPFVCLQHLVVRSCPSLVGTLPCQLDRLVKLEIHSCPHLDNSTSVVRLPSLRELYLEDCSKEILKSLVNLTSLIVLKIENLTELVCFDHGFRGCLVKLRELHITRCDELSYLWQDGNEMLNLTCLQELVIGSCPRFTSFVAGEREIELPCNLERMELRGCTSLEKLLSKMDTLRNLLIEGCPKLKGQRIPPDDHSSNSLISQLEYLEISECDSLASIRVAKGRLTALKTLIIWKCEGVDSLEEVTVVAESLESLTISRCEHLGSLPRGLHTLSHLTLLVLEGCPALEIEDFPPLPITLSSLTLWNCPKIRSIASCNIVSCKNLTSLKIWECPALEIEEFPLLPITLSYFCLIDCPKIKSLPSQWHRLTSLHSLPQCLRTLSHLTRLDIRHCPALEIEDFPPLPITLSSFYLIDCPKIKSLPNEWHHLSSLQELRIVECPNIKCFPKGGFPPNLRLLVIERCENVKQPMREWGLPLLTSLYYMIIDGKSMGGEGEKVCFPPSEEDAWSLVFPSSLTDLRIYNMRKVERLSSGLPNHLSSLQLLWIFDCPMLRHLPEDGLPPSLQSLRINRCSNLKEGCSKLTGHYWPLIQHLPFIEIDWVRIQ